MGFPKTSIKVLQHSRRRSTRTSLPLRSDCIDGMSMYIEIRDICVWKILFLCCCCWLFTSEHIHRDFGVLHFSFSTRPTNGESCILNHSNISIVRHFIPSFLVHFEWSETKELETQCHSWTMERKENRNRFENDAIGKWTNCHFLSLTIAYLFVPFGIERFVPTIHTFQLLKKV